MAEEPPRRDESDGDHFSDWLNARIDFNESDDAEYDARLTSMQKELEGEPAIVFDALMICLESRQAYAKALGNERALKRIEYVKWWLDGKR